MRDVRPLLLMLSGKIKMKYHEVTPEERAHLFCVLALSIEDRRKIQRKCHCRRVRVADDEDGYHFLCLKCADRVSRFARR